MGPKEVYLPLVLGLQIYVINPEKRNNKSYTYGKNPQHCV